MYMITKGGWGHIRSIDQLQIISAVHMYMMKKKRGEFGDTFVWQINYNFSSTHVYDLKKREKGGGAHSFDRSITISAVHMYMIKKGKWNTWERDRSKPIQWYRQMYTHLFQSNILP